MGSIGPSWKRAWIRHARTLIFALLIRSTTSVDGVTPSTSEPVEFATSRLPLTDRTAIAEGDVVTKNTSRSSFIRTPHRELLMMSGLLPCRVRPLEPHVHLWVVDIVNGDSKLVEYNFSVANYTLNPLLVGTNWTYKLQVWSRVVSSHGQTILDLAFNYGMLSLMTLTFGVRRLDIELEDVPRGCLVQLDEQEKVEALMSITLRDLSENGSIRIMEGQSSVCYQVIRPELSKAKFVDRCCYLKLNQKGIECFEDLPNKWLEMLDILLACLVAAVFLFGPVFMPDWLYSANMDTINYTVKLKEPLYKSLCVCRREVPTDIQARHTVDLRNCKNFIKFRLILSELPSEMVIPIKVSQFDILANYRRLLPENRVPVGMTQSISRALFMCKLRELKPFEDCCNADILGGCAEGKSPRPWIKICSVFGRLVLMVCIPIPFIVRLLLYYTSEYPEIMERDHAARRLGLGMFYNYRLMQYFGPSHPVFIAAYVIYLVAGIYIAVFGETGNKTRFQQAIKHSFEDLKDMTWLHALGMAVRNLLLPFKKYGVFGCFLGIFIWPIFVPLSFVVCFVYCLPIVFLTCRILYHTFKSSTETKSEFSQMVHNFEAEVLFRKLVDKEALRKTKENFYCSLNCRRWLYNICMSTMSILTLYSIMLMISEVAGFLADVMCFTMMGLIVNASKVLRYGSLIFLVIIYSYDTYNNVNKKYLKLNKALFNEIQHRIKDIDQFTSLPSHLQENMGFKACEASEQADHETTDDLSDTHSLHWTINDLILFIDSNDVPRIPRELFDEVCAMQVAGSPGPVYRSLLQATGKFIVIIMFLLFVFIVIMSFGDIYKISSTNQTLATLAGGFLPFIFTNLLKPAAPEVETGLLSFKSHLEEIIKNFYQAWPMRDFAFDIEEEPVSEQSKSEEETDDSDQEANSKKSDTSTKSNGQQEDKKQTQKKAKKHNKNSPKRCEMKNKKDNNKDGFTRRPSMMDRLSIMSNTRSIEKCLTEVKTTMEDMELEPAENKEVDIVVLVSETDHEWLMEWSSVDMDEVRDELKHQVVHHYLQPPQNHMPTIITTFHDMAAEEAYERERPQSIAPV